MEEEDGCEVLRIITITDPLVRLVMTERRARKGKGKRGGGSRMEL